MKSMSEATYNERLFSGGFRGWLHSGRFLWLRDIMNELAVRPEAVLELGCYDGRAIDYLPAKPRRYEGYDANVENGLGLAAVRWRNNPEYRFHLCHRAEEMSVDGVFDTAIALETLEHIRDDLLDDYLAKISRHLKGYFFVTVPNERGAVFLARWSAKRLLTKDPHQYTRRDVVNHALCRIDRVSHETSHKGFDYRKLLRQIDRHFEIVRVDGIPFGPKPLAFNIGIVAHR